MENGAVSINWLELHNGTFLDANNTPGLVYFGIQLVHRLVRPNDTFVAS